MTRNQIEYQRLVETNRANLATEKQTALRDSRSYEVASNQLGETKRHNEATEILDSNKLAETGRHNLATENEAYRSNVAREFETNRSNVAKETETYRSNLARESETHRSNVAQEAEARRSHKANEALGQAQLAETTRSNKVRENISKGELKVAQSNAVTNAAQARNAAANVEVNKGKLQLQKEELAEAIRANQAREFELNRHNTKTEELSEKELGVKKYQTGLNTASIVVDVADKIAKYALGTATQGRSLS